MKITCPSCDARYTVPADKLTGSKIRATCVKCGSKILVSRDDGTETKKRKTGRNQSQLEAGSEKTGEEGKNTIRGPKKADEIPSLKASSPPYPKYRDPLIFSGIFIFLLIVVGGIYFAVEGTQRSLRGLLDGLVDNPIGTVTRIMMGSQRYDLVEVFLEKNERNLPELGRDLKIVGFEEEVGAVAGRKTAAIVAKVNGSRATGDMIFRLEKRGDTWHIVDVSLRMENQQAERLFP